MILFLSGIISEYTPSHLIPTTVVQRGSTVPKSKNEQLESEFSAPAQVILSYTNGAISWEPPNKLPVLKLYPILKNNNLRQRRWRSGTRLI